MFSDGSVDVVRKKNTHNDECEGQPNTMLDKTVRWLCALLRGYCCLAVEILTCDEKWQHTFHMKSSCITARDVKSSCSLGSSRTYRRTSKNLWHRKCARRVIFWNVEYFLFYNIFKKKETLSQKTIKNCFGGTSEHFVGKGGILP